MSNQAAAIKILKSTTWFSKCSNELITALAAKLELLDVGEGHVFISEGLPMDKSMILESGSLFRTKMHVVDDLVEEEGGHNKRRASLSQSLRNMKAAEVSSTIQENAVVVDIVQGHGHVTGLLHIFSEDSCAFATVTSKTPAKVWIMSAKDFREILSSNPAFMLDIMGNMATELRTGGKSLRAVMSQLHSKGLGGDAKENEKETLRVLCYDTTSWVSDAFQPAVKAFNADPKNSFQMMVDFTTERLGPQSATYSAGYEAICTFVNDTADAGTIQTLSRLGVNMIAQRAAGFDRVDTKAARAYGMTVARVPAYSPYAVAEMAIALLMAVNRKTTKASSRVKMANFSLDAGLLGVDIHGKTVGVMGTGKIGQILCNIILGFGAKLICYDVFQNEAVKQAGGVYVTKDEILPRATSYSL